MHVMVEGLVLETKLTLAPFPLVLTTLVPDLLDLAFLPEAIFFTVFFVGVLATEGVPAPFGVAGGAT